MSDVPKFDITDWKPEGPASLQFMGLLAPDGGYVGQFQYEQRDQCGKIRTSSENRKHRRKALAEFQRDDKVLLKAVSSDNFAKVRDLVQSGSDVNYADERKRTALHMCAAKGNVAILELLLSHGADPNMTDVLENTPLHLAACVANIPVITCLLKAGARVDALDSSRRSPLRLARGRLDMLRKNLSLTTQQFVREVNQVIDMMKQYALASGTNPSQLDMLCDRFQHQSSLHDVDILDRLLEDLSTLHIDKTKPDT